MICLHIFVDLEDFILYIDRHIGFVELYKYENIKNVDYDHGSCAGCNAETVCW